MGAVVAGVGAPIFASAAPNETSATNPVAMAPMKSMPAMMPLPETVEKTDPDMKRVLEVLNSFNAPPLPTVQPNIARELPSFADALLGTLSALEKPCVDPVAKIVHKVIAGPGGPLLIRIYTPAGSGPFPVVVYFHGGGYVIANLDTYDASARMLAKGAGAVVVSVAYRQAPEHPFPAAPQDGFAAYKWALANAAEIAGDARRVAVAGESAGGNCAAVVCMMAQKAGVKLPVHQLLVYPITNWAYDTASYQENLKTIPLNKAGMEWFGKYYLSNPSDAADPMASPLRAKSVSGLPSATIINAEYDPLRDDGKLYAEKLKAAGVPVTRTVYSGTTHEFFGMGGAVEKARQAMAEATSALKERFEKT